MPTQSTCGHQNQGCGDFGVLPENIKSRREFIALALYQYGSGIDLFWTGTNSAQGHADIAAALAVELKGI
jgi:hypothetical protein